MPALRLPQEVESVLREFFTCEFTTVNRQGQPLTWPTLPYFHQPAGQIIVAASIAFPVKALNARRHPQVSLLYSDPTGAQLSNPPAVLIQGDTHVFEMDQEPPPAWTREILKMSVRRQPDSKKYLRNRVARRLFLFYYQRLAIIVEPRRILVWPQRDFGQAPQEIEVAYVE
jgi:hypothetical protein